MKGEMILSKENLKKISDKQVLKPTAELLELPEKILQFGTGVLLRGLVDYFVDKANHQGIFNGRIVVVKSTEQSKTDAFAKQDCLYTLAIKGIEQGQEVEEYQINSAISRVLSAQEDWEEIMTLAQSPAMKVVFSNTTEVGIVMSADQVSDCPPSSFPGKLLAFLYARFQFFKADKTKGLVVVPAELVSDNGDKLKQILLRLAEQNKLSADFISWLVEANSFCNTLVDRIVPGAIVGEEKLEVSRKLGYADDLAIMAEPFRLWAIESSDPKVAEVLSFEKADKGIFIVPSINKFKELKLRLLNGTHTLSCALALWSGYDTVKQAMQNPSFYTFVRELMLQEIAEAIIDQTISKADTDAFAQDVLDRFANPHLDHQWKSIALNYTSKMNMRNVQLIEKWYQKFEYAPPHISLGFAAYALWMKSQGAGKEYHTRIGDIDYTHQDEYAALIASYWASPKTAIETLLADTNLWGQNLNAYPGFTESVQNNVLLLSNSGAKVALEYLQTEQSI